MGIKRIEVKNFKSFKDLKVDLGQFNVLIGANASGKSNFSSIFQFLSDITTIGLVNAISQQGGVEYLKNMKAETSDEVKIKVILNVGFTIQQGMNGKPFNIEGTETTYEFVLGELRRFSEFEVKYENLEIKSKFKSGNETICDHGKIIISRSNKEVKVWLEPKSLNDAIDKEEIFPFILMRDLIRNGPLPKTLLIEEPFFTSLLPLRSFFNKISIYDFDPKLAKKAVPFTGKAELESDGSNLPIVLRGIIEDHDKKRKFLNITKNLLPFVESLDVKELATKPAIFIKEHYFDDSYIPASLISDGTINITALIVALYFEKKPFIIIEEPERNIHPHLISRVVEMMKDASRQKQILVTTHNPEFVKHAGIENLLLVSRDKDGFSTISRPAEKEEIKTFLKNDLGIEELYIQNLLDI